MHKKYFVYRAARRATSQITDPIVSFVGRMVTVAGRKATVAGRTVSVPGRKMTVAGRTVTVPGRTVSVRPMKETVRDRMVSVGQNNLNVPPIARCSDRAIGADVQVRHGAPMTPAPITAPRRSAIGGTRGHSRKERAGPPA